MTNGQLVVALRDIVAAIDLGTPLSPSDATTVDVAADRLAQATDLLREHGWDGKNLVRPAAVAAFLADA